MTDINITTELLAAYVEGNVSKKEQEAVRLYLAANPEAMQSVLFAMDENGDNGLCDENHGYDTYSKNLASLLDSIESGDNAPSLHCCQPDTLPMQAMAAQNAIDNQCAIWCEGIAIRHFGISVSNEELQEESERASWLQPDGTALHNIGRLAGARGLSVSHRYHCTTGDIQEALSDNHIVIAAVDSNELLGDYIAEQKKDKVIGLTPNHVIIVSDITSDEITITDSATPMQQDTYPLSQFLDAWEDSSNYLIIISDSDEYIPHPINLDDVEVEDELIELREAIAENAHEVWAATRRDEGWTYGPQRDDHKKQHPDMLPYNRLPESEKEYDRVMAMNTIKLVKKLGWELRKKN